MWYPFSPGWSLASSISLCLISSGGSYPTELSRVLGLIFSFHTKSRTSRGIDTLGAIELTWFFPFLLNGMSIFLVENGCLVLKKCLSSFFYKTRKVVVFHIVAELTLAESGSLGSQQQQLF